MAKHVIARAGMVAFLLTAAPGPAAAQELASSFDQLRVLVKSGDRVRVSDAAGHETKGTIAGLSADRLALLVDGHTVSLTEDDIRVIRRETHASLGTGAKWGFGVGAGFGVLVGLALVEETGAAMVPMASLIYGGLGAGIGVGICAMMPAQHVIYSARGRSTSVLVAPLIAPDRKGVVLSVGF
jgi:hypothetical protein